MEESKVLKMVECLVMHSAKTTGECLVEIQLLVLRMNRLTGEYLVDIKVLVSKMKRLVSRMRMLETCSHY